MQPKITKELIELLENSPRLEKVYFETETGDHHFNHVKEEKGGKLTVNGKEVVMMTRKDILKPDVKKAAKSVNEGTDEGKSKKGTDEGAQ